MHRRNEIGLDQRHGTFDFGARYAVAPKLVDLYRHGCLEQFHADARARGHVDDQQVRSFAEVEREGRRLRRNLLLAHERAMQPAAPAHAEHGAAHARRIVAVRSEWRRAERQEEPREHHVVLHDLTAPFAESRRHDHGRKRRFSRAARNVAEVLLHQRACLRRVEIAGDREHRVVRRIERTEELFDVFEARGGEVFERPDERVVERMRRWKCERGQPLPPRTVGLVVHRPTPFVLHHVTLRVELLLRHRRQQRAHPVGLEPERHRELVRWHRFKVIRAIKPGGTVERAARALNELEVLVRADMFRSLKQHVLEQVRESGAPFALVR